MLLAITSNDRKGVITCLTTITCLITIISVHAKLQSNTKPTRNSEKGQNRVGFVCYRVLKNVLRDSPKKSFLFRLTLCLFDNLRRHLAAALIAADIGSIALYGPCHGA